MKARVQFSPGIILALLLILVIADILSAFLFFRLDSVVHGDLYHFGLQFSYEWAGQYWFYSQLTLSFLAISVISAGISAASVLVYNRTRSSSSRFVGYALLSVGVIANILSAFFLNRLDSVVHGDLYRFGLQFSYEWASQYWLYSRMFFSLQSLSITTCVVSIALIFFSARPFVLISFGRLMPFTLFAAGAVALVFSINYNSSVLAFIGLGLMFWGIITRYITTEEYVKKNFITSASLPPLMVIDELLKELDYKSKAVYLPPRYLQDIESSRAYIPRHGNTHLPPPERILKSNSVFVYNDSYDSFINDPEGVLLVPPGNELAKLFEKTLDTSFTKVNLAYIEQKLPKLLTEDLEIAEDVKIETEESLVHVRIEGSVYRDICKSASLSATLLGWPISSAIACILAKATGKPVIISKEQTSQDGRIIETEYKLVEEAEEKTQ